MRPAHSLALLLSADLRKVAEHVSDGNDALHQAHQDLAQVIRFLPEGDLYRTLDALHADLSLALAHHTEAEADLTGRNVGALLRKRPNRG